MQRYGLTELIALYIDLELSLSLDLKHFRSIVGHSRFGKAGQKEESFLDLRHLYLKETASIFSSKFVCWG